MCLNASAGSAWPAEARSNGTAAREKQSANAKLTFKDAVRLVFLADPDLNRAYNDATPPLRRSGR